LSAGLIDGINPCAFVTLIFFISYLTITGQRGKKLLAIGITFISAVFITYLLIGIGIFKFLYVLQGYSLVSKLIYLVTGLFTLGLVFFNINDSFKAKRGKSDEIRLQLPKGAKRLIHTIIRRQVKVPFIIAAAALTGILISLFEFSCTGQVYLPTIVYMTQIPSHRLPALMYLIFYNIMFILPLFTVFVLVSILGEGTKKIGVFFTEKIYVVKLITAGFFLILSGYMFFMSARLFGLIL
jgi:hypothetical protein